MSFTPAAILKFWLEDASPEQWFMQSDSFDQQLIQKFGEQTRKAQQGAYDSYVKTPHDKLALLIMLDQFSRNVFRGTAEAFAGDERALRLGKELVASGDHEAFTTNERIFTYLPFEHSENLADQQACVALYESLGDAESLDYAEQHLRIIERFSRFPHRNEILGRVSTAEELHFLTQPNSSF